MKQLLSIFIFLSITFFVSAQTGKDTTVKKEIVHAIPRTDTVQKLITYGDATGNVKYTYGFILISGFVIKENNKLVWAEQPTVTAFLDNKKKPLKNVIQYFDLK